MLTKSIIGVAAVVLIGAAGAAYYTGFECPFSCHQCNEATAPTEEVGDCCSSSCTAGSASEQSPGDCASCPSASSSAKQKCSLCDEAAQEKDK